jgi:hypothetical protein
MAAVGALGSTARLGCLVRLSTQLGREHLSKRSLFKNNLRLLSHTLALNTPTYDRQEDDVASTPPSPLVMDEVSTESTSVLDDPWENHSYDNSNGNNASSWPSSNSMGMKDMLEPPPLPELD